ncbi:MAG TPA: hypothetical protein VIN07_01500, partial [Flavipsychrobacter sp.]
MDYLFENLNPETFQQFCQALLIKEFPHVQVLNVGQKDGGRDSLAMILNDTKQKEFIVFQVKFVREPHKIKEPHKWLIGILEEELPKIISLIPKGAKSYILLTNVKGTSIPETGSIDKIDKLLRQYIPINSQCYWRDDIARRLDGQIDLKWSYPQILHGQDVLNSIVFHHADENRDKRESVVRAYLVDQYEIDNEVKFKQIELQNNLFDLFVDVPIRMKEFNMYRHEVITYGDRLIKGRFFINSENLSMLVNRNHDSGYLGGASLLLSEFAQRHLDKVIVEGGPGQGKSTITQYVCQIHRARLLSKNIEIQKIPQHIIETPIRLPFKIDLRDLATWVSQKNPYSSIINEQIFSENWGKSLEQFLRLHIIFHSQIFDLTSSDLLAIFRGSHLLFVFDGFDEIADFKIREEIVQLIQKGLNRLSENSKSIQTIITSRPAAITNVSGFSNEEYPHLELMDVNPIITSQYVEKWILSRRMNERDATAIRTIVNEKLELPHMKDLAKTPMQLAILLSLLNTRGESLPNKRTALYDSYIDLFFNRESEKNIDIRNNRDLIINIHQYLAWVLHSEAELSNSNGRIDIEQLKDRLKQYLIKEGHKTDLADTLFTVVNERVCALVSRIQGYFEFEVQPLREYFCAKYLYNTSPYTPAGYEKSGTKPERFDALTHNYYWQNVVRFFAGCFDRGELPLLNYKLGELNQDENYKHTNYPLIISSYLLSDFVFAQTPILQKPVIDIITKRIETNRLVNQSQHLVNIEQVILSKDCGLEEFIDACLRKLATFPKSDYCLELTHAIKNNSYPVSALKEKWEKYKPREEKDDITKWLEYSFKIKIFHSYSIAELEQLLGDYPQNRAEIFKYILLSNNSAFIEQNKEEILNYVLGLDTAFVTVEENKGPIFILSSLLKPFFYVRALLDDYYFESIPFSEVLMRGFIRYDDRTAFIPVLELLEKNTKYGDPIDTKIQEYVKLITIAHESPMQEWKTTLTPWNRLISEGQKTFGDHHAFNVLAIISSGIRSQSERYSEFNDITDTSIPICYRLRNARLKSGNIRWWREQFNSSSSSNIKIVACATFIVWATVRTITELKSEFMLTINSLDEKEMNKLIQYVKHAVNVNQLNSESIRVIATLLSDKSLSDQFRYLLCLKLPSKEIIKTLASFLEGYNGNHGALLELKLNFYIGRLLDNNFSEKTLSIISTIYKSTHKQDIFLINKSYKRKSFSKIPLKVARSIVENASEYPT